MFAKLSSGLRRCSCMSDLAFVCKPDPEPTKICFAMFQPTTFAVGTTCDGYCPCKLKNRDVHASLVCFTLHPMPITTLCVQVFLHQSLWEWWPLQLLRRSSCPQKMQRLCAAVRCKATKRGHERRHGDQVIVTAYHAIQDRQLVYGEEFTL